MANFLSINAKDVLEMNELATEKEVRVFIKMKKKELTCPSCKESKIQFKEWKTREIKHALFLNRSTIFILKERRYRCLTCGKTFNEPNMFAAKRSRISHEVVHTVLEMLRNYNITYRNVADILHISDTTVINIFDRYVNISRRKLPRILSIDECYNDHQFERAYSAILFDFLESKIVDIIQGRRKETLFLYFNKITKEERENVQYVIIDMWEPYLDVAQVFFPTAIVAIDSFHVLENISRAVDFVRRRILRRYKDYPSSKEYYLLKKWEHLLYEEYPVWEEKHKIKALGNAWLNRKQLQDRLYEIDDVLKRASQYYLRYKTLNKLCNKEMFEEEIEKFINDESVMDIPEMIPILQMLSNWKEWILNSFIIVDGKRLSNGPIEGFNSNYKKVMRVENGVFSFERFRNRIIYSYNKMTCLHPVKQKITKRRRGKRGKYKKKATESR